MKIRIFSPFFPYPRNEGAFITISEQAKRLAELGHSIELFFWKGQDPDKKILEREFPGIQIKRIPGQEKEPSRLRRILSSLFSPWSSAEIYHYSPTLESRCQAILTDECDLEIFQYSFAGVWLKTLPSTRAKRVVVFHNCESLLYSNLAFASTGFKRWLLALNAKKLARHERLLSEWCDELWFNSAQDLKTYGPDPSIHFQPRRLFPPFFSLQYLNERRTPQSSSQSQVFGFVGGLQFRPNHLSALWILEHLAPELEKQNFSGKILIIGKSPNRILFELAKKYPFVKILGFIEDLSSYWNEVTFTLSPHVEGSGIRMKLLESLVKGVQVITHPEAIQQLPESLRKHPFIFSYNSAPEWAKVLLKQSGSKPEEGDLDRTALTNPPDWFHKAYPGDQSL